MDIYLTREQVRLVDKIAIEEYGIPGIVLMENAAIALSEVAENSLAYLDDKNENIEISVVCGGGNNGGDGYAVARHLHIRGYQVKVFALTNPTKLTGDAAINRRIVEKMKLPCDDVLDAAQIKAAAPKWRSSKFIFDAILGTGFSGELRPHIAHAIREINAASALSGGPAVIAVDLPSGLDCDTGVPSNPTVRADYTFTFVARKIGFQNPAAKNVLGGVIVAQIGAPPEILDRVLQQSPTG